MRLLKRELLSNIRRYRFKSAFFFNFIKIFGIVAVLAAVIGSIFVYINTRNIKNEGAAAALNNSQKANAAMDAYLDDARKIAANFLIDTDAQWFMNGNTTVMDEDILCNRIIGKIYSYKNLAKGIDSIYIYSQKSGRLICNRGVFNIDEFDDNTWAHDDGTRKKPICIVPRMYNNVRIISVIGSYGEGIGYIAVNINVNIMRQNILKEFPELNARITDDKQIVFSTNSQEFMNDVNEFNKTNEEYKRLNEKRIVEYSYTNRDFKLNYLIQIPIANYTDIANTMTATTVIFILIILLLGMGISVVFAAYASMPISNWGNMLSIYDKEDNADSKTEIENITQKIIALIDNNESLKNEMDSKMTEYKKLQLLSLQTQINPHYMNNTLGVIGLKLGLKCGWDDEIVKMINCLSESLRYSFNTENMCTTIKNELNFLNKYISIINYCYPSIDITVDVDEELYDCGILRVSIQPLVENSVFHGMKNRDGGGKISICIRDLGEYLELNVSDDGNGMDRAAVDEIMLNYNNSEMKGVGLKNVIKRFAVYYGEKFEFTIDGTDGTSISLKYPKSM